MTARDTAAEPRTAAIQFVLHDGSTWTIAGLMDFIGYLNTGFHEAGLEIEAQAASGPALTAEALAEAMKVEGRGEVTIPHTTEGDIECSCKPLVLTVEPDGSISRVAGGPLEEPVDTGPTAQEEGS